MLQAFGLSTGVAICPSTPTITASTRLVPGWNRPLWTLDRLELWFVASHYLLNTDDPNFLESPVHLANQGLFTRHKHRGGR